MSTRCLSLRHHWSRFVGLGLLSCAILVASQTPVNALPAGPVKRVRLAVSGMDCKACEPIISDALMRTPGVIAVEVSYERAEAVVDYDPGKITPAGIIAAIKGAGFTAKIKR